MERLTGLLIKWQGPRDHELQASLGEGSQRIRSSSSLSCGLAPFMWASFLAWPFTMAARAIASPGHSPPIPQKLQQMESLIAQYFQIKSWNRISLSRSLSSVPYLSPSLQAEGMEHNDWPDSSNMPTSRARALDQPHTNCGDRKQRASILSEKTRGAVSRKKGSDAGQSDINKHTKSRPHYKWED